MLWIDARGGIVTQRHNEVQDVICDLVSMVWGQVIREPVVCNSIDLSNSALVADIGTRGVWLWHCLMCVS